MNNTAFYKTVYEIVAEIPEGTVATYGQIAWMAGRPKAPRMVGYAMSHVPEGSGLPCHRVVNRLGEMAPYHVFGGGVFQRQLLEQEGVTFLKNGRIDMKRCQWKLYGSLEAMEESPLPMEKYLDSIRKDTD